VEAWLVKKKGMKSCWEYFNAY